MQPINYFDLDQNVILGEPGWIPEYYDWVMEVEKCPLCASKYKPIKLAEFLDLTEFKRRYEKQNESVHLYALACSPCNWFVIIKKVKEYDNKDHGFTGYTRSVIKHFDLQSAKAPTASCFTAIAL